MSHIFTSSMQVRSVLIFLLWLVVFCGQYSSVIADLAPNEDDDEDANPPTDLKKDNVEAVVTTTIPSLANLGFIHAFVASFSVIIVSEIGDKTFFIAAIMSMKYPRWAVFSGAISALALMTVLSAVFGMVFIQFIPPGITRWVSVGLFVVFGLKMLHEGWNMSQTGGSEELEEVQHDIRKREDEMSLREYRNRDHDGGECSYDPESGPLTKDLDVHDKNMANKEARPTAADAEAGLARKAKVGAFKVILRIFLQAFTMTFLAEWGDRSQITTIILAARENLMGVITGGIIGHSICTGLAVIGGRILASKISVRTVTLVGGVVFIIFAITSSIFDPNDLSTSAASVETSNGN